MGWCIFTNHASPTCHPPIFLNSLFYKYRCAIKPFSPAYFYSRTFRVSFSEHIFITGYFTGHFPSIYLNPCFTSIAVQSGHFRRPIFIPAYLGCHFLSVFSLLDILPAHIHKLCGPCPPNVLLVAHFHQTFSSNFLFVAHVPKIIIGYHLFRVKVPMKNKRE